MVIFLKILNFVTAKLINFEEVTLTLYPQKLNLVNLGAKNSTWTLSFLVILNMFNWKHTIHTEGE